MSTRIKFLLLLLLIFCGTGLSLELFMQTNYAKNEWAFFQQYPLKDMAARQKKNQPAKALILTAGMVPERTIDKILKTPPLSPPLVTTPTVRKSIGGDTPPQMRSPDPIKTFLQDKPIEIRVAVTPTPAPLIQTEKNKTPDKTPVKTPQNEGQLYAEWGYEAYRNGDYAKAIAYFEQSLKLGPERRDIHLQLAYAAKIVGQNAAAVNHFKTALDLKMDHFDDAVPFILRREVEQLENRFEVNGYVIYRDEASTTRQLGADLTQSQAGVELSYQPGSFGFHNGRKFQIYGRLLTALEQDQLKLNPDSYQAGFGLRMKPFAHQNLVLSAERLVKVGRFARNDWMARAGYSYDHGTDYREDSTEWWSYSLYLDAALIDLGDPDIFLTSQATGGYNFTLARGLVIQPRLTGFMTWQKDSFREASLIEAGPGVNIRYYFNDSKYEAYRSFIDLTGEYRIKITGNSIGGSGPVVSLAVHF